MWSQSFFTKFVVLNLLFSSTLAWANTEPRYKLIPSFGWSVDRVVDLTSAGTVTGVDVSFTALNCTAYTNSGKLTADAAGNIYCADDAGTGSASGDITSVGDVATGAAFDGTQGTVLTFFNASGNQTLTYSTGGDLDFNFSDDVNIRDTTPHVQWVDTTASEDDFEAYADKNAWFLTNVTDATELMRWDAANKLYLAGFTTGSIPFIGLNGGGVALQLAQDNANFFWDNTTKQMGIGDATPDGVLDVTKSSSALALHGIDQTLTQTINVSDAFEAYGRISALTVNGTSGSTYEAGDSLMTTTFSGSGTQATLFGIENNLVASSGTVSTLAGYISNLDNTGGTITNRYAIRMAATGSAVTDDYGLYDVGTFASGHLLRTKLTLTGTNVPLVFDAASGTDFEALVGNSTLSIADTTNNKQLLQLRSLSGQSQVIFPQLGAGLALLDAGGTLSNYGLAKGALVLGTNGNLPTQLPVGGATTVLVGGTSVPSYSSTPTIQTVTVQGTTPMVTFDATTGSDFEANVFGSTYSLADTTNNKQVFQVYSPSSAITQYTFPGLGAGLMSVMGTGVVVSAAVPDCDNATTGKLLVDTSRGFPAFTCGTDQTSAGGGGSPAGSGSEWQYRVDGSTFGAITGSSVSGANATLAGNLTLSATTPALTWDNATGTDFEISVAGSLFSIADTTSNKQLLGFYSISGQSMLFLPQLTSGVLSVDGTGLVTAVASLREFVWPAAATLPLEFSADSIPPIAKVAGTNVDSLVVNFDDSTDECRFVTFDVPQNVRPGGTVTFRTSWYDSNATACGTSCEVMWYVQTKAISDKEQWDQALTTTAASASSAYAAQGVVTNTTWTATASALGFGANKTVECQLCRDANHASDDLVGDASLISFVIQVPVTE